MADLRWRSTWPDKDDDYTCLDGEKAIGRVYPTESLHAGRKWKWFAHWPRSPNSGEADSRAGAMQALEDAYLAAFGGKS